MDKVIQQLKQIIKLEEYLFFYDNEVEEGYFYEIDISP